MLTKPKDLELIGEGYRNFCYNHCRDIIDLLNKKWHDAVASNHANPEWVREQKMKGWKKDSEKKKRTRLSTREAKWADDPIYQLSHHAPTDCVWTNQQKLELFSHFTHYSEVCTLLGKTIEELGSHFFSVANNVEGFTTPTNEILAQREQRRQEREEHKRQAEAERQALAQRRQAAIDYCRQPGATRIEFQRLFPKEWGCKHNIPELFALLEQLPQQTTEDVMQQILVVDHKPVETYKPDTQAILAANPPRYKSTLQWTEERLRNLIIERGYRTPTELRKEYRRAQTVLYQRFPHLLSLFPDYRSQSDLAEKRRLWTLDYCIERCKPYLTVKESKAAQPDLESWIYHHGWSTVCHAHMKGAISKPRGMRYHTTYHIIQQARTREQFQQEHPDLYEYALTVKSLREAMDMHFPNVERIERHNRESIRLWQERNPLFRQPDGNGGTMRCIYVCEFPDNHAYVGLTDNPDKRRREHGWKNYIPDSAVAAYKFQTGQQFQFKILADFMPELEAQEAEGYWKQQYIDQGWQMLNRAPTGSLGGSPRFYNPMGLEDGNENNLQKKFVKCLAVCRNVCTFAPRFT